MNNPTPAKNPKGAGRKPSLEGQRIKVGITLPAELAKELDKSDSKSITVENALIAYLDAEPTSTLITISVNINKLKRWQEIAAFNKISVDELIETIMNERCK